MAEQIDSPTGTGTDGADMQADIERAKAIVVEFASAAQSAAISLADEQKHRAASQVGGIAEAMRAAAHSLDRSQTPTAAHYVEQAADRIEEVSRSLHERRWGELLSDIEGIARRQPVLFVLGAVAVGFLAGRFLSLSADYDTRPRSSGAATREVSAAVSSASGNRKVAGWTAEGGGSRETP